MKKYLTLLKSFLLLLSVALLVYVCHARSAISKCDVPTESSGFSDIILAVNETTEEETQYHTDVRITELMASNRTVRLPGIDGFPDWIELTNTGMEECSLKNYIITDGSTEYVFDACVLQPGERLALICDRESTYGYEYETGFSLGKSGETIEFLYPDGKTVQTVTYENASADLSYFFEGTGVSSGYNATPGYSDDENGRIAYIESSDFHGDLVINEAVNFNDTEYKTGGEYFDWIELKNASDSDIKLSDYYITDDSDEPYKFNLPDKTLSPGELFIVLCCGDTDLSGYKIASVNFAISGTGDTVYLYDSDGMLSDCMGIYDVPLHGSIGRMDGESGFFLFEKTSPEEENTDGFRFRSAKPEASLQAGLYDDVDSISIELITSGNGTVYYTLDGSVPDEESSPYTEPITIQNTTVIRAVCVEDGKMPSEASTFSYIVNEGISLPVVSVVCDQSDFKNFYQNYSIRSLYCDANVSYFDGDDGFVSDCRFKLHGASARSKWNKKSFKISFQSRYGGDVNYDLFSDGSELLHSFILRGGSETQLQNMRDPLVSKIANIVSPVDTYTLDGGSCVLFINGEYWGIYGLREAYSEQYVANHTGGDADSVQIVRAVVNDIRSPELTELIDFITDRNMSDAENYAYASEHMDMKSLATWMCFESYFNNLDPNGNIRYVKSDAADGKWQLMLFDFDIAITNNGTYWGVVYDISSQNGKMCISLKRSAEFTTLLLETMSELIDNGLGEDLILQTIDEMIAETEADMPRNLQKWIQNADEYAEKLETLKSRFSRSRTESWLGQIKYELNISDDTMHEYFPDYY